jgi:hypothetical protein
LKKLTQAQSEATIRFIIECLLKDCDIIIQAAGKEKIFEDMSESEASMYMNANLVWLCWIYDVVSHCKIELLGFSDEEMIALAQIMSVLKELNEANRFTMREQLATDHKLRQRVKRVGDISEQEINDYVKGVL